MCTVKTTGGQMIINVGRAATKALMIIMSLSAQFATSEYQWEALRPPLPIKSAQLALVRPWHPINCGINTLTLGNARNSKKRIRGRRNRRFVRSRDVKIRWTIYPGTVATNVGFIRVWSTGTMMRITVGRRPPMLRGSRRGSVDYSSLDSSISQVERQLWRPVSNRWDPHKEHRRSIMPGTRPAIISHWDRQNHRRRSWCRPRKVSLCPETPTPSRRVQKFARFAIQCSGQSIFWLSIV